MSFPSNFNKNQTRATQVEESYFFHFALVAVYLKLFNVLH